MRCAGEGRFRYRRRGDFARRVAGRRAGDVNFWRARSAALGGDLSVGGAPPPRVISARGRRDSRSLVLGARIALDPHGRCLR